MQPFDSRQADEVATLLALAEHGSFAAAGRALQRHPSVLSKRLGALERRLGIRLVERTTRQLRFTDEGERLASRFRQAVDLLDEAGRQRNRCRSRALAEVQRIDADGGLLQPDLAGARLLRLDLLQAQDLGASVCVEGDATGHGGLLGCVRRSGSLMKHPGMTR